MESVLKYMYAQSFYVDYVAMRTREPGHKKTCLQNFWPGKTDAPCTSAHTSYYDKGADQTGNCKAYCKVPKFSDARNLCCNLPKIQTKRPKLKVFC